MKPFPRACVGGRVGFPGIGFRTRQRACFSLFLLFATVCFLATGSGGYAWAAPAPGRPAAFTAAVAGSEADLNDIKMASGGTLFPGDVVRLGEASTAALRFGGSLVLVAPLTELVVETGGVMLRNGLLQVRASGERPFDVDGPFFHVNLATTGGASGSVEIRIDGAHPLVSAVSGVANLTAAGSDVSYRLRAGETASLDAPSGDAAAQNAASPAAGKVARLLPQVQIERASQTLMAAQSDPVFWNDNLLSGPTGRAHVTLDDGSLIYLGSNSSLRILQHDAQGQQTSLDLAFGRMRGKVVKLTRPGAKFEIRTPVGVAGLVGTDFTLLVTNDHVELMVMEGIVRFTTLSGQFVSVTAGMILRISRVGILEAPRPATRQETQTAQNLTDIPGTQTATNQGNGPLIPILISVGTGGAIIGVSAYLDTPKRQTISPITPGNQIP